MSFHLSTNFFHTHVSEIVPLTTYLRDPKPLPLGLNGSLPRPTMLFNGVKHELKITVSNIYVMRVK